MPLAIAPIYTIFYVYFIYATLKAFLYLYPSKKKKKLERKEKKKDNV